MLERGEEIEDWKN